MSYARFLDELRVRGLPFRTDEEGMQRELEELKAKVVRRARRRR